MNDLPTLEAKVRPFKDESDRPTKLKAFVELMIAGAFVIKGIRILQKEGDEPFIVFPAEKGKGQRDGQQWFDIAHPVTAEARGASIREILAKYTAAVGALMLVLLTSGCAEFKPIKGRCVIEGVRLTLTSNEDELDNTCRLGMNAQHHDSNMPPGQERSAGFAGCADVKAKHIVADPSDGNTIQHEIYHLMAKWCPGAVEGGGKP